eukprot:6099343-Alexandrium_andersonii.AAC.1
MSASLVGSEMCIRDSLSPKVCAATTMSLSCGSAVQSPAKMMRASAPKACLLYTSDAADDM